MDNERDKTTEEFGSNDQQPTGQQYYNNNYQQYQQPPGGYYNMYQQPKPVRKRKGLGFLIAFFMVLSFIAGGLLTAFVIMPLVETDFNLVGITPQDNTDDDADNDEDNANLQLGDTTEPQTTSNPQIGGSSPSIDQSQNPIVQIAKEVSPTVVGISVSVESQPNPIDEAGGNQELGYGTGIVISDNGYIATNNHVVAGSDSINVTFIDGTEYEATLVGADKTTDLAVIKIDAEGLTPAGFGESDQLLVGETVVAIGNPLGSNLAGSVTSGIVSALDRVISTEGYSQKYIQTDAAINPGNSGGPLVNIEGKVIGINTLKTYLAGYDDYGVPIGTEGIGFAIPTSTAIPILEQLMTAGSVERPGIGISCLVDVTNAYNPEGSPDGVTVVEIVENGPADKSNMAVNDIITAIDDVQITTVEELVEEIKKRSVGDEIELTIWRDGEEYSATVEIGDLNKMG